MYLTTCKYSSIFKCMYSENSIVQVLFLNVTLQNILTFIRPYQTDIIDVYWINITFFIYIFFHFNFPHLLYYTTGENVL